MRRKIIYGKYNIFISIATYLYFRMCYSQTKFMIGLNYIISDRYQEVDIYTFNLAPHVTTNNLIKIGKNCIQSKLYSPLSSAWGILIYYVGRYHI